MGCDEGLAHLVGRGMVTLGVEVVAQDVGDLRRRVEASDDERFAKADFGGPDYKRFASIYNSQNDYMMFLRRPIPLTSEGNLPVAGVRQLATIAAKSMLLEG